MKGCFRFLLGLFCLFGFFSSAEAIKIRVAEVQKGTAVIQGSEGAKNATITWEGLAVTQVNPNGGFSFNGVVPANCVGTLSDGVDTIAVVLLSCTPVPGAPVPQTGLITSFDENDPQRDDGALRKGVILPSPRFTDNLDGTITDHLTGLIWLKNANCPGGPRIWQTALSDVLSLNTTGSMNGNNCGDVSNAKSHQTDWRLPNMRELHSLININVFNPAISNTAGDGNCINQLSSVCPFSGLQSAPPPASRYWSSSATPFQFAMSLGVWVVDSFSGEILNIDETTPSFVIAVRGGL
jgi:hypothetical protein